MEDLCHIVAIHLTSESVLFVHELLSEDAVTGTPPHLTIIDPYIRFVVDALYGVFAGTAVRRFDF